MNFPLWAGLQSGHRYEPAPLRCLDRFASTCNSMDQHLVLQIDRKSGMSPEQARRVYWSWPSVDRRAPRIVPRMDAPRQ